ncbi:hypothetical protein VitviT2T_015870 [Vitis vinifera]|uniref:Reverse transcriptase domain-containing protein n=1 Tax=Vitis vinifera TaxID=29760 RepID=A0ABY9CPQ7_VITVI|nr:hypothetical protein VitviT2T_015870 [Vitis vinifera]
MANVHNRRNWLSKLKVNGCWYTEENDLKNSVVGAFKKLYTDEWGWRPWVEGLSFMRLASNEAEGLEIPFSEGEVYVALLDLGKDKAPDPDGFTMAFWLFCWDVVKIEIMGFFREFHERGRFVKSLNATFLVLVPKKGGAEYLKDFRPISLVGSLQVVGQVLIANKAVDSRLKDNVGGVLCKLDIEKAYDHVSWSFLLAVLKKMGLGERWIKWIDWCISTVKFSVLINGSGLKINLEKSELIPVGRVHDIEGLALELGCKVGGLPPCYLGLPLGVPFNSLAVWDGVEERFCKRLAMWKRQYISKGGRLTLIRSTLSSMPIYFMSLFYLPRKVRLRLDSNIIIL